MSKVGDGNLIPLIVLVGAGAAVASGVSVEDGLKKASEYATRGAAVVEKMDTGTLKNSLEHFSVDNKNNSIFIGTSEIVDDPVLSEEDLLKLLYEDISQLGEDKK